jgi:restriction system protein
MNWQMNPNSLFAVLLRKPWWVSTLVAAAVIGFAFTALPGHIAPFVAAGALPFVVIAGMAGVRALRTPGAARIDATVAALRAMAWPELSATVADAWRRDGWTVTAIDDRAADFQIEQGWRRGLVSCRRWKVARLGAEPLRELAAARERLEVHDCWCVVTGDVSEQARRFAAEHRVTLVEGADLAQRIPPAVLRGSTRTAAS